MLRLSCQWRKDGERTTTSRAHFGRYPFTGRSLQSPSAQTCTSSGLVDLRWMSVLRSPKPWNKALRNWSHVCIDAGMRARPVLPSQFDRKSLVTALRLISGLMIGDFPENKILKRRGQLSSVYAQIFGQHVGGARHPCLPSRGLCLGGSAAFGLILHFG
jgi:hypothetical protein